MRPIVAAATLAAGASASAQTICPIKGSDTLFEVMTDAITKYRAEVSPTNYISYIGTGSGNGEKAMALHSATPWQLIAPMSRNLTSSAQTTCETRVGAGSCRPEIRNVVALDAAVTVEASANTCRNLALGIDSTDPQSAPAGNLLQLILGGKDGKGTWTACTHPDRVAAIEALVTCNTGSGTSLTHWYRRDDNSGTSDTIREKLKIERFCNGESKPPTGGTNLNNPDNDPIRTPCPQPQTGRKPVKCTITDPGASFGTDCSNNPTATGCTAGFVIAISEADGTLGDITMTVADRVRNDVTTSGYAGREAVRQKPGGSGSQATGAAINTNQYSDLNVRGDKYMLSRRLWLQDTVVQNGVELTDTTGDAVCDAAERQFFHWATDGFPASVSAYTGRENLDPIVRARGFIPCTDDFTDPQGETNLCSKGQGPNGFPYGAGAATKCTANTISSGVYQATTCTAGTLCCSDGLLCEDAAHSANPGKCPVPAARPAGYACTFDSDCASAQCDLFGSRSVGTCL